MEQTPIEYEYSGIKFKLYRYYPRIADWYEPETCRWIVDNARKGWTVIDVGANVGAISILAGLAMGGGRLYAIEANKEAADMCQFNLDRNGLGGRAEVWRFAAGNVDDSKEDRVLWLAGTNKRSRDTMKRACWDMRTLDTFCASLERLDLIKIDVDGWDYEVLVGATETVERWQPFILVEINYALHRRGNTLLDVIEWLESTGYILCDVLDERNWVLSHRSRCDEINVGQALPPMVGRINRILNALLTVRGMASWRSGPAC